MSASGSMLPSPEGLRNATVRGEPGALEAAWMDALAEPPAAAEFLAALASLSDSQRNQSAGSLLGLLLEAYEQRNRHADTLVVVRALAPWRSARTDLRESALRALAGVQGHEPWYELFETMADVRGQGDLVDALDRFEFLAQYVPGRVVYHRSGWGEGLIDAHDLAQQGLHVNFRADGVRRFMPFTTGLQVLVVLPHSDLRARLMVDVEGLREEAEAAPERLLAAVARLHRGKASVKEIKALLGGSVIPDRSWNSWWKKAKVAATRDPFLAVENPARPVFILRERALTPEEELKGKLSAARTLPETLEVVRGPLSLDPSEGVRAVLLARLSEFVEARAPSAPAVSAAAPAGAAPRASNAVAGVPRPAAPGPSRAARAASLSEAALLLRRHAALPEERAAAIVDRAVNDAGGFAALVSLLPDATVRREALDVFVAARPQLWSDAVIGELTELPPQLLDAVADRLAAEGRAAALANRFHILLLAPSRHASAVLRLARRFARGDFADVPEAPRLSDVFMGVLHLAETQAPRAVRGDKPAKEVMRLVSELLLARKDGLADAFGRQATRSELATAVGVFRRCPQMPDEIVATLHRHATARYPDLVPKDVPPFWESTAIFSTQAGIVRRNEEYRVLIHEKIPANSSDIGRAAGYGDLSENYEWTAAIEQQRQLTEKAAAMEAELKLARPLEEETREPGVVAPGMSVSFQQDGSRQQVSILGPWDAGPGVISYRAPLAAGMLGARVGETVEVVLPSGSTSVKILEVRPALA